MTTPGYTLPRTNTLLLPNTTATSKELQVYEPCRAWHDQAERWELIEALLGGTLRMRDGGERWLPREPKELPRYEENRLGIQELIDPYQTRLKQSVCPPFFQRLESMLAGMLTRKPIRLEGTSDQITEQLFDVDRRGNDLQRWFSIAARRLLRYGHIGVLVDFPRTETGTVLDPRPYWVPYTPQQIIGWRTESNGTGDVLTQLRLWERLVVPYKDFGEETVEQVRVLEPGRFRLFRKQFSTGADWTEVDNGTTTTDEIPFAVAYVDQVDTLHSRPPLEEVAWLNLLAYQRSSDLANLLHRGAIPRTFAFGVPAEVDDITNGPETATALPVDARIEIIEPGGTSYQWQFKHLEEIERQINQLGLAAVISQKMVGETAEAKAIDRSQGDSALQIVAHQMQDMIDNCLRFHAAYIGDPQPGSCRINRDFVSAKLGADEVNALIKLEADGRITQETLLTLLADGEWLGDDFDVASEITATEAIQQQRMEEMAAQMDNAVDAMGGNRPPVGGGKAIGQA